MSGTVEIIQNIEPAGKLEVETAELLCGLGEDDEVVKLKPKERLVGVMQRVWAKEYTYFLEMEGLDSQVRTRLLGNRFAWKEGLRRGERGEIVERVPQLIQRLEECQMVCVSHNLVFRDARQLLESWWEAYRMGSDP